MKHNKAIKPNKVNSVSSLEASMKEASSIAFVDYTGLTMKQGQALKKKLVEVEGSMIVVKNTLIKIAGKNASLPEEALSESVLSGQTAIVMGQKDPVSPLQVLAKFMSENEKPKWKAGVVEGIYQDAANIARVSKLPGKDQLIAQVIGGVSSPLYGLLSTLNGNLQKLVYVLNARATSMNGQKEVS